MVKESVAPRVTASAGSQARSLAWPSTRSPVTYGASGAAPGASITSRTPPGRSTTVRNVTAEVHGPDGRGLAVHFTWPRDGRKGQADGLDG